MTGVNTRASRSATRRHFSARADSWVADWIGVPWLEGGRDRTGLDCLGLVLAFYRASGYILPDPASMNPAEVLAHPMTHLFRALDDGETADYGDVLEFADVGRHHIGVLLFGSILHCVERGGVHIFPVRALSGPFNAYRLRSIPAR